MLAAVGIRRPTVTPGAALREPAPVKADYWIHSVTSADTEDGIVSPSAAAVFTLTTSSKTVACSTGMTAGLVPLRILPTKPPVQRTRSFRFDQ
jgi:hypothetical protein